MVGVALERGNRVLRPDTSAGREELSWGFLRPRRPVRWEKQSSGVSLPWREPFEKPGLRLDVKTLSCQLFLQKAEASVLLCSW